jgi:L-lysine 6-transaminase
MGTTGTAWAYQQLGVQPDIVSFSKKAQLGGVMAGGRVDEVADNVFAVSGRINSTWGGGLVDMVRARRILEIIETEGLIDAAVGKGERFLTGLQRIAAAHPGQVSNPRGRGLFLAVDLPTRASRDAVVHTLLEREHVIVLPCGDRSVRFRPALSVSNDEVDEAVAALERAVALVLQSTEESK